MVRRNILIWAQLCFGFLILFQGAMGEGTLVCLLPTSFERNTTEQIRSEPVRGSPDEENIGVTLNRSAMTS